MRQRLLVAGIICDGLELARSLEALRRQGRVALGADRRWRLAASRVRARSKPDVGDEPADALHAVAARADFEAASVASVAPAEQGEATPLPRLLRYFAAALRNDARAAAAVAPGRHGQDFLLLQPHGAWRPLDGLDALLRVAAADVPAAFRETVARAGIASAAVGWPVMALRNRDGGVMLLPVLTISAGLVISADELTLRIGDGPVAINPEWLKGFAKRAGLDAEAVRDRLLFGDDGERLAADLAEIANELAPMAAQSLAGSLDPDHLAATLPLDRTALHNMAAVLLPGDSQYTRAAAADLDALAERDVGTLGATALGPVFSGVAKPVPATAVLNPAPLTGDQLAAARSALSAPLTVVTGPPGSGKSQVIAAVLATVAARGGSALLASRNHQAIDAVQERLDALSGDRSLIVRALDSAGESVDFLRAAEAILAEPALDRHDRAAEARLERLDALDARRDAALQRATRLGQNGLALSEVADRLDAMAIAPQPKRGVLGWLSRLLRLRRRAVAAAAPRGATRAELEASRRRLAVERGRLLATPTGDPFADDAEIAQAMAAFMPQLGERILQPTAEERGALREGINRLRLGRGGLKSMEPQLAAMILRRRPIWAVSTLGAPRRLPPVPGLFDLVVFDEASQCDVASAAPLLARARRAVVVGDPAQLTVINGVSVGADRELLRRFALEHCGAHRFAQSLGSLFDAAAAAQGVNAIFLSDQFRSDPEIVDYINNAFYGRRLRPRRARSEFKVPPGAKPGVGWRDVKGPKVTDGGRGCACREEADTVAERLASLAEASETGAWRGSVGVIAPFNQQVGLIERRARAKLSRAQMEGIDLKIATVDRFQGGERDLILFSLCGGADMPPGARRFLSHDRRRFNVAISRARAACEIIGDVDWARISGVDHLERLVRVAGEGGRPAHAPLESPWEERLRDAMLARGLAFQAQYEIAGSRLDFALFRGEVKLDVEVDGRTWHMDASGRRKATDDWRDFKMRGLGWKVRRFWVFELRDDMEKCIDLIESDLAD